MQMQDDLLPGTVICLDSRARAVRAMLGMTAHGTVEDNERKIRRPMDYIAQGVWVRMRNTTNPVGPCFGLDRFCLSAALITG